MEVAALLPGAEADRAVPHFAPALSSLREVPWESWAKHRCCGARRENSGEALCRGLSALAGQIPSTKNTETQSRARLYLTPALLAQCRGVCPIGIQSLQRAADAPNMSCSCAGERVLGHRGNRAHLLFRSKSVRRDKKAGVWSHLLPGVPIASTFHAT